MSTLIAARLDSSEMTAPITPADSAAYHGAAVRSHIRSATSGLIADTADERTANAMARDQKPRVYSSEDATRHNHAPR